MRLSHLAAAVVCDILLATLNVVAVLDYETDSADLSALWLAPSTTWYGIDGTWSNFALSLGTPLRTVYLTPATALSEVWVVQNHGCADAQICYNARGGVFNIGNSVSWRSLGSWQLGLSNTGMGGNGDYGLESISFRNGDRLTDIDGVLIGAINDTDYYQGFIGLGVTQGKFGTNLTLPLISQLAQTYGTIHSSSYGYTAGAFYRPTTGNGGDAGTPASLVLGGYDTLRFVPHNLRFPLDPMKRLPVVKLRGVTAEVPSLGDAPGNWTSTTQSLVTMNDSIKAIIDTSTPYLWMPTEVCERFADAFGLKWNETLGVYVYADPAQYNRFLSDKSLSIIFSISSYDNTDDFGRPLNVPGVVNITFPSAAFAQVLKYPFGGVIEFEDPTVPYFPLKRSTKEVNDNQYIIGRAFMQEAYMITRYDKTEFSLYQASFPLNGYKNTSLVGIDRNPDSPYPAFTGSREGPKGGLSTSQTVGVVLSAFATGSVIGFILWCCCRRRKKAKTPAEVLEESKEDTQSIDGQPRSPVKRMFSMIIGRKRSKKPIAVHEVHGNTTQPVEVGADEQHQVFELPVPPEPVELDTNDAGYDDDTDVTGESSHDLSAYEIARRKMARQLQGPVPTYTPTETSTESEPREGKSGQDISPVAHYRPSDDPSPVSSPTYANSNSLPDSLPSPLSPHPDWQTRMFDLPSPMTVAPPVHMPLSVRSHHSGSSNYSPISPRSPYSPHAYAPSSISRSNSSNVSPTSAHGSLRLPPTPTVQRTPIDPSRVVCLGPLPEDVPLPGQQAAASPVPPIPPIPQIVTPDSRQIGPGRAPVIRLDDPTAALRRSRASRSSSDSLGSNFTVEEEERLRGDEAPGAPSSRQPQDDDFPRSPRSMERIEAGCELVHVPQVAEKRYSWEDK
ncbi:hypothetical protein OQA88_2732 [Cercophora sp. LCS_1]